MKQKKFKLCDKGCVLDGEVKKIETCKLDSRISYKTALEILKRVPNTYKFIIKCRDCNNDVIFMKKNIKTMIKSIEIRRMIGEGFFLNKGKLKFVMNKDYIFPIIKCNNCRNIIQPFFDITYYIRGYHNGINGFGNYTHQESTFLNYEQQSITLGFEDTPIPENTINYKFI